MSVNCAVEPNELIFAHKIRLNLFNLPVLASDAACASMWQQRALCYNLIPV